MALLLGIDLGTSYFKAGLYTAEGALKGLGRKASPLFSPAPGRREMEAEAFWTVLRETVETALGAAKVDASMVAALSYSSQANSFLLLDHRMRPLSPVISWQDVRSLEGETPLREYWGSPGFFQRTGMGSWSPQVMPGKLEWFRHNKPAVWQRVHHVFTISDYLASTLVGEPVGDSGTASLTGIWDIPGERMIEEVIGLTHVEPSWLPRLHRPGSAIGKLCSDGASRIGLVPGIPMAAGSLDHHAAAIGSGLGRIAPVSISTGTVLAALRLTDVWQPEAGVIYGPDWQPGRFFALVADDCGAGILEAFRKRHAPGLAFEDLLDAAGKVSPATKLPRIPPEAWTDPDPRHLGENLTGDPASWGVIVLAMMETIARRQRVLLQKLCGERMPKAVIATGGGARSPLWLQLQARSLGTSVLAPENPERACLGAAVFASVATGVNRDVDEASRRMVRMKVAYEPDA